ncbi:MAG TPA: CRTAC1 family protein [Planctomycetota bacterium]|nr:CRTAC1 family protein [Planctomycetota bacterium]
MTLRLASTILALGGCTPAHDEVPPRQPGKFVDVSAYAGIDAKDVCGEQLDRKRWILEVNGPGAALFDCDGDGDLDVWLTNGSTIDRLREGRAGAGNTLWLNDGTGRFADATAGAGIGGSRWGNGIAVGDVDNDGDLDVFVAEIGPDLLYLNDGKGHFREVGAAAGLRDPRWSASAIFVDFDRDGDLDLFVANYLGFDLASPPAYGGDSRWHGLEVMRGPRGLPHDRPALYRNDGAGPDGVPRFRDVTAESGISKAAPGYPLGVTSFDYDLDGDDDLYVANDSVAHQLFENRGDGTFVEVGEHLGVAFDNDGNTGSGMGVCVGDYDQDGRFDLLVTTFSAQPKSLFRNRGRDFQDRAFPSGVASATLSKLGWGCRFLDADRDGWPDLFLTNGHVYPEADGAGTDTSYAQTNQYLRNLGNGKFQDRSADAGLTAKKVYRGAAFGDLDGDGDEDVLALVLNGPPVVLRNDVADDRAWIGLELVGAAPSNQNAYGAIVRARVGSRVLLGQCQPGSSFQCSNDPRVRFGLGDADSVDDLEIRWPSGRVQHLEKLPARRVHRIVENAQIPVPPKK